MWTMMNTRMSRPMRWMGRVGGLNMVLAMLGLAGAGGNAVAQCVSGWLPVPMVDYPPVESIAVLPNGDVIIGGHFDNVGGVPALRIARYTPSTGAVASLGQGLENDPLAFAVLPNGDFVAGGGFQAAGGTTASHIARYSSSTGWTVMGTGLYPGLNHNVNAVAALPNGDIIAGGRFTSTGFPGGPVLNHIARYTPSTNTWAPLGSGTGGSAVNAVAVLPNGDIIAGGDFDSAGGVPASFIARYTLSTNTWSAMGEGTNNNISALAVLPDGDVVVSGGFQHAGGVLNVNFIARYAPATNTWSAMGLGTDATVTSLAVLPGGDVLAGGYFLQAGGIAANYIARYSPSTNTWSALGTGTNNAVLAVAADAAGNAYAGGLFTSAGGQASRFGLYSFGTPLCPGDFNCDGFIDFFDYDAFVGCFETEVCNGGTADFNRDGFVDFFDYSDFVLAFETGC